MAIYQNSFNGNQNGYAQSSILGVADMNAIMPDYQETLFNTYGDQYTKEYQLWQAMHGTMQPTANPEGGFLYQEDRFDKRVTVAANSGTSGTVLSFTIAAGEVSQLGSSYYVYPQANDIITDMATMNRGIVRSVTGVGSTFTVVADSETNTAWTTPVSGQVYAITGTAFPENSTAPLSRNSYWTKKTYTIQVQRQQATATDLALGSKLYPIRDQLGNTIANWGGESYMQVEFRLLKNLYTTMWVGTQNSNTTSPQITSSSYFQEFSTGANAVDVAAANYVGHFQDLTAELLSNSPMSMNYFGYINSNLVTPLQDDFFQVYQNANIVAVSKASEQFMFGEGASEGMSSRFDFQSFTINGMTYNIRTNKPTYDPECLGVEYATNNYFANTAYFMPSQIGRDAEGNRVRNCMLRYLEIPGVPQAGSRKVIFIETGGLATGGATNNQLNRVYDVATHSGAQFCNLPQCGYFYKPVGS